MANNGQPQGSPRDPAPNSDGELVAPELPTRKPLSAGRLMRPWWLAMGGAALLVIGERLAATWANQDGAGVDRVLDLSLLTFLSITMVWAPMWTMRIVRRAWRRLDRAERLACAWQVLLQGFVVAPALWVGVSWLTQDVQGGRILAVSAAGSALISLGGAVSLGLRSR